MKRSLMIDRFLGQFLFTAACQDRWFVTNDPWSDYPRDGLTFVYNYEHFPVRV